MPHDKQVVIAFLTGKPSEDTIIEDAIEHLMMKWNRAGFRSKDTHLIHSKALATAPKTLQGQLSALGPGSRLYICGHGDWIMNTCAGLSGKEVAKFLAEHKLSKSVGLISVISCDGAIGDFKKDPAAFISLHNTRFSFVYNLHFFLGEDHGIKTVCHGRVGSGAVGTPYEAERLREDMIGRKYTKFYDFDHKPIAGHSKDWTHHRSKSKVVFFWEGELQKMNWVDADFQTVTWVDGAFRTPGIL